MARWNLLFLETRDFKVTAHMFTFQKGGRPDRFSVQSKMVKVDLKMAIFTPIYGKFQKSLFYPKGLSKIHLQPNFEESAILNASDTSKRVI